MPDAVRPGHQRKADTIAKFEAVGADAWVATGSPAGAAHLIPLSFAWNGECLILAAQAGSLTVRNIRTTGVARLGFGPTRDVVLVDCMCELVVGVTDPAAGPIAAAYTSQADWDPRDEAEPYLFMLLRPRRIQAWREANELGNRLLMQDGAWLVEERPHD